MPELASILDRILGIASRPTPIAKLCAIAEQLDGTRYEVSEKAISAALASESWAGPVHRVLQLALARWDHEDDPTWTDGTRPNTADRRARIYELLEVSSEFRALLDKNLPFFSASEPLIVIADRLIPWYTAERRAGSTFYWSAFKRYLEEKNGWDPESLIAIDESTTSIVERISDPSRPEIYQAKGLVVGYVQSGKTANITGVIAKAADAGYRLFIVMSGTMNLLRAQTQRRIDRELIGKELIALGGDVDGEDARDYILDADWPNFIEHGALPSELGAFDWIRLTGEADDYHRLRAGIEALNFERRNPAEPFYAAENLRPAKARIMVVKKNADVLRRVAQDLRRIAGRLAEVPALVIDDESDLASINTARPPTREEERRRTTINRHIVELLRQLPRAQYIGYTATPFANVFVDPADAADLFPKDFIVALPRPRGYMGASDFHDLEGVPDAADDPYRSNYRAFIRDVHGDDDAPGNLLRAIDSFVLAGAIKLYRESQLPADAIRRDPYRHHTMLVHASRLVADQEAMADVVLKTLRGAGYEGGSGLRRLRALLVSDFAPVTRSRAPELPFPSAYEELHPFIGQTLSRLWGGGQPVLVVNGEPTNDDPDFEKQSIWKILVGGAKLSRGYTVEGLTISYFRRTARAGDTLMQMGRWFGFRELYQDLVRVFIGRAEGRGGSYDLYEAFEAVCRDEEAFRRELQRYAMPPDGQDPIMPMQVPPLVASHLQWVPPTSRNKMFNAQIRFINYGGQWVESTLAPTDRERDKLAANEELMRQVLATATLTVEELASSAGSFEAIVGVLATDVIERLVREYKWTRNYRPLQRHLEFMQGTGDHDPNIRSWALIAPRLRGRTENPWRAAGHDFTVKYRRRIGERVGVYTEPVHRAAAQAIVAETGAGGSAALLRLRAEGRGVMLFYPLTHDQPRDPDVTPTMGFALLFPHNNIRSTIVFGVADPSRQDAPVVDVPSP